MTCGDGPGRMRYQNVSGIRTMEQPQQQKPGRWYKGMPSPNPSGRTPKKILTTALVKALEAPWHRGRETGLDMVVRRLLEIIATSDERYAIRAIELLWKYLEGMPQQAAEIDFERALADVAARTGAPVAWLTARAKDVRTRFSVIEGGQNGGQADPGGVGHSQRGQDGRGADAGSAPRHDGAVAGTRIQRRNQRGRTDAHVHA